MRLRNVAIFHKEKVEHSVLPQNGGGGGIQTKWKNVTSLGVNFFSQPEQCKQA